MGAAASAEARQKASQASLINDKLKAKKEETKLTFKILLLGAAECGKSTVMKQMKRIMCGGFTDEEVEFWQGVLRGNLLTVIKDLLDASISTPWGQEIENSEQVQEIEAETVLYTGSPNLAAAIKWVWDHKEMKVIYEQQRSNLLDSAVYLLDRAEAILAPDYKPNADDIVRGRQRTTGIVETAFKVEDGNRTVRMFDVGGQRGERTRWMSVFDDVNAIMFIASLSEYDQFVEEDSTMNRQDESLEVFKAITSMSFFRKTPIFLFLNKDDIFREKIAEKDMGAFFPHYQGKEKDYDDGLAFIKGRYERRKSNGLTMYTHVTNATNKENVQFVWKAASSVILESKLDGVF